MEEASGSRASALWCGASRVPARSWGGGGTEQRWIPTRPRSALGSPILTSGHEPRSRPPLSLPGREDVGARPWSCPPACSLACSPTRARSGTRSGQLVTVARRPRWWFWPCARCWRLETAARGQGALVFPRAFPPLPCSPLADSGAGVRVCGAVCCLCQNFDDAHSDGRQPARWTVQCRTGRAGTRFPAERWQVARGPEPFFATGPRGARMKPWATGVTCSRAAAISAVPLGLGRARATVLRATAVTAGLS